MPKQQNSSERLRVLNQTVIGCERCERLRTYCRHIAEIRRRAYREQEYWGRPVPSFGDPAARVLLMGLAPGAHGSNRTGRPFTGDGSGNFLYPVLYDAGFASQRASTGLNDGMVLTGMRITSVARCAPPDNKPKPDELHNCSGYLDEEIAALTDLRVIVCLGRIAMDGVLAHLVRTGTIERRSAYPFAHGAEYRLTRESGQPLGLLASYHPSLQNTNTGRLTAPMLLRVMMRARELALL